MGCEPQVHKGFPSAANRHYFGASLHVGDVFESGEVILQANSSTRERLLSKLDSVLGSIFLQPDDAGKLCGHLVWYFSLAAGLIGKLIAPVLRDKKVASGPGLSQSQWDTVLSTRYVIAESQPRIVSCRSLPTPSPPPTVICSDASCANNQLILGWVVFLSQISNPEDLLVQYLSVFLTFGSPAPSKLAWGGSVRNRRSHELPGLAARPGPSLVC